MKHLKLFLLLNFTTMVFASFAANANPCPNDECRPKNLVPLSSMNLGELIDRVDASYLAGVVGAEGIKGAMVIFNEGLEITSRDDLDYYRNTSCSIYHQSDVFYFDLSKDDRYGVSQINFSPSDGLEISLRNIYKLPSNKIGIKCAGEGLTQSTLVAVIEELLDDLISFYGRVKFPAATAQLSVL